MSSTQLVSELSFSSPVEKRTLSYQPTYSSYSGSHSHSVKSRLKLKKLQSAVQDPDRGVWKCRHCSHVYSQPNPSSRVRRHHKKQCPGQSAGDSPGRDEGGDSVSYEVAGSGQTDDSQTGDQDETNSIIPDPKTIPDVKINDHGVSQGKLEVNLMDLNDDLLVPQNSSQARKEVNLMDQNNDLIPQNSSQAGTEGSLIDISDDLLVLQDKSQANTEINWMDVNDDLIVPQTSSLEEMEVNWMDDIFAPPMLGKDTESHEGTQKDIDKDVEDGEEHGRERDQAGEALGAWDEREFRSVDVPKGDSHEGDRPSPDSQKDEEVEKDSRSSYEAAPSAMDQRDLSDIGETVKEMESQQLPDDRLEEGAKGERAIDTDELKSIADQDETGRNQKPSGDAPAETGEGEAEKIDPEVVDTDEVDHKSDDNAEYHSMDSEGEGTSSYGTGARSESDDVEHLDANIGDVGEWEQGGVRLPQDLGSQSRSDYLGSYVEFAQTPAQTSESALESPTVVEEQHEIDAQNSNLGDAQKDFARPGDEGQASDVMLPQRELSNEFQREDGSEKRRKAETIITDQESGLPRPAKFSSEATRSAYLRFERGKLTSGDAELPPLKSLDDEDDAQETLSEEGDQASDEVAQSVKYDIEKLLREQNTFDLICPVCRSRITDTVILRKRKRKFISKTDLELEEPMEILPAVPEEPKNVSPPKSTADKDDAPGCFGYFPLFARRGD